MLTIGKLGQSVKLLLVMSFIGSIPITTTS